MTRTIRRQVAEAAQADALFSGLTLSGRDVQQLHGEILLLESLVRAVDSTGERITVNDVNGRNWFDVRDEVMA